VGKALDAVGAIVVLLIVIVLLVTLGFTWQTLWQDIGKFFAGATLAGLFLNRTGGGASRVTWLASALGTCLVVGLLLAPAASVAAPAPEALASTAGAPPPIRSISVYTAYPGQNQYLAIPPNTSAVLVYPAWTITLITDENLSYAAYLNGLQVAQGTVNGQTVLHLNVTGQTVSVQVGFGDTIYRFDNEFLSTVPLSSYYAPTPPPLVATEEQVLIEGAQVLGAFVMAVLGAMFVARRIVIERKKRQIQEF
jgi:hypothetical protein